MQKQSFGALAVSFVLTIILFVSNIFFIQPSYAGIAEDLIGKASANFVKSVLDGYQKEAKLSFDNELSNVNKTIDDLSTLLNKAIKNPNSVSERQLSRAIESSQNKLTELANNFNTLADQTDNYNRELETSLENLLSSAKGDVRNKFQETEKAYKNVASALGEIVSDASNIDTRNLSNIAGKFDEDINSLKTASEVVNQAFKAFAS